MNRVIITVAAVATLASTGAAGAKTYRHKAMKSAPQSAAVRDLNNKQLGTMDSSAPAASSTSGSSMNSGSMNSGSMNSGSTMSATPAAPAAPDTGTMSNRAAPATPAPGGSSDMQPPR